MIRLRYNTSNKLLKMKNLSELKQIIKKMVLIRTAVLHIYMPTPTRSMLPAYS